MNTRLLVRCAALTALALIFSFLERLLPYMLIVPLPGVKPGLANIITLFTLLYLAIPAGLSVLIVRCFATAVLFGTGISLLFSLAGSLAAFFIMAALLRFMPNCISIHGVSMAGAAAHSIGQMTAAVFIMGTHAVLSYLPLMLLFSIFCGVFISVLSALLFPRLKTLHS